MYALTFLLVFSIFVVGVLVGVRCQEINLQGRERRLAGERRRVNAQIRALQAHREVNNLIWQARNELREAGWLQARGMPFVIDHELEVLTVPSQRNGPRGPDGGSGRNVVVDFRGPSALFIRR